MTNVAALAITFALLAVTDALALGGGHWAAIAGLLLLGEVGRLVVLVFDPDRRE